MLTVVSWNVDGLARLLPDQLAEVHATLGRPDVLCLQEVRIRPGDATLVASMESALPSHDCFFSLCHDPLNVRFRGGRAYGVATYVRSALAARASPPPTWDREGRLVLVEVPQAKLALANVYAVNGTNKPFFNHELGCLDGDRHGHKRRFQRLCQDMFSALRDRGRELLLIGDWNVSRTALDTHPRLRIETPHVLARAQLNDVFMPSLDVVDAFRERHPTERQYTWFNRSAARYGRLDAARVDYALISRSLLPSVVDASIEQDRALQLGSDHAPVRLSLDIET